MIGDPNKHGRRSGGGGGGGVRGEGDVEVLYIFSNTCDVTVMANFLPFIIIIPLKKVILS